MSERERERASEGAREKKGRGRGRPKRERGIETRDERNKPSSGTFDKLLRNFSISSFRRKIIVVDLKEKDNDEWKYLKVSKTSMNFSP